MARIPITGQEVKAVSKSNTTAPEPNRKETTMANDVTVKEIAAALRMTPKEMIREWKT